MLAGKTLPFSSDFSAVLLFSAHSLSSYKAWSLVDVNRHGLGGKKTHCWMSSIVVRCVMFVITSHCLSRWRSSQHLAYTPPTKWEYGWQWKQSPGQTLPFQTVLYWTELNRTTQWKRAVMIHFHWCSWFIYLLLNIRTNGLFKKWCDCTVILLICPSVCHSKSETVFFVFFDWCMLKMLMCNYELSQVCFSALCSVNIMFYYRNTDICMIGCHSAVTLPHTYIPWLYSPCFVPTEVLHRGYKQTVH